MLPALLSWNTLALLPGHGGALLPWHFLALLLRHLLLDRAALLSWNSKTSLSLNSSRYGFTLLSRYCGTLLPWNVVALLARHVLALLPWNILALLPRDLPGNIVALLPRDLTTSRSRSCTVSIRSATRAAAAKTTARPATGSSVSGLRALTDFVVDRVADLV